MTAGYITHHTEQRQLLPSALQDWLPEGHLAYLINDTIDSSDLSSFHAMCFILFELRTKGLDDACLNLIW